MNNEPKDCRFSPFQQIAIKVSGIIACLICVLTIPYGLGFTIGFLIPYAAARFVTEADYWLGEYYEWRGMPEKAIEAYSRQINFGEIRLANHLLAGYASSLSIYYRDRANQYEKIGRLDDASRDYDMALIAELSAKIIYSEYDLIISIRKLFKRNSNLPELYLERAESYEKLGNLRLAEKDRGKSEAALALIDMQR
jgi:tetratricopeptide (TPR) repeat protein